MAIAFIHVCAFVKNLELEHGNNLPVYWLWQRKKSRINPINQFHYQLANSQWQKYPLALAKAVPIFASRYLLLDKIAHAQFHSIFEERVLHGIIIIWCFSPLLISRRLIDWLQPQYCTLTLNLWFENEACKRQNSGQGRPGVCGGTQWNIMSIFGVIAWKMFNFRMNYDDASRRID